MKIKILHTNDIHSRFENYAKIVTKIKELKDENTLLLDAGDFNDFIRLELQGTNGKAGIELLDAAGYDAIAIGNNETNEGTDILETMSKCGTVKLLACNFYKNDLSSIGDIRKNIIINKGELRFLIIGVTPRHDMFLNLMNMKTTDYIQEIKNEMKNNKGKYDMCVVLSHLGLQKDRELAEAVDEVNIIIGGHSHDLMDNVEIINNTAIHMSGMFGQNLGVLEFEYDGMVKNISALNINTENLEPDNEIMKCISKNKEIAIDNLSKPLFKLHNDVWHDVVEENPITNLLADGLRDFLKCDIGIINSGVINGGVRKGDVSKKKLLEICPSPLNPTIMDIKGKYIREAIENSLKSEFCMQDGKGAGFRGKYLGKLHVSNMTIKHNGRVIKNIFVGDEELKDDKTYTVATSDYLKRGTGYESLKNNENEVYKVEYLRDTIEEYLSKKEYVEKAFQDRWIKFE